MKTLKRFSGLFIIVFSLVILGCLWTELLAMPPSNPNPPRTPIPWGNFAIIAGGCLSYGLYKLFSLKRG